MGPAESKKEDPMEAFTSKPTEEKKWIYIMKPLLRKVLTVHPKTDEVILTKKTGHKRQH